MRSLGQRGLDLLDRFGLREPLHGGDFTRQPVERRLVELALGIGLFRLRLRAEQIADDLGDGDDVAGIDLGLVFLRPARHIVRLMRARPLSVSSARFTIGVSASLRMPTEAIFEVGTRNVILSLTKLMTKSSSRAPATSCSSIAVIWPTP